MTDQYTLRGITSDLIEQFWPFAEPYVKRALDHRNGEYNHLDVKTCCLQGTAQLWLVYTDKRVVGAVTTNIVNYTHKRHCCIATLAGSNMEAWAKTIMDTLGEWAVGQKCNGMETYVPKVHTQKMQKLGFVHKYSILIQELKNDRQD